MQRAVEAVEARGMRGATWLFVDPAASLMLEARLERRIDHLLDITTQHERPVDPLEKRDGAWGLQEADTGAKSSSTWPGGRGRPRPSLAC